jgi:hypothetical protein
MSGDANSPNEAKLLEEIQKKSLLPTELVAQLKGEISYREVQGLLSKLIESGAVTLDSNLRLHRKRVAA